MKNWIIFGNLLSALAVILGAFGAHALKARITPEDLAIFETGVKYHFYHALGLILIGLIGFHYSPQLLRLPAIALSLGILLFSGSLYLMVLSGARWLGAVTPLGGVAFIAGWLLLAFNLYRSS
jgi:uncharacterized membrane protein YgdD (TMEM256/DUF423 family)